MMARRLFGKKSQQEQEPQEVQPQSELEARAEQEIAMLQQHEQYKKMLSKTKPVIGEKEVRKASETLRKYKEGKARLEAKIIANEEFWKMRQWNYMNDGNDDFKPATAWLHTCIESRHSDVMDGYPTCKFLPRQEDDKAEAKKLSAIMPIIFEHNRYEETYSDISRYTFKQGGNLQGVFWDTSKHNGLGDISIKKIDFINLFWESGITNIQKSRNVFHTELVANEILEQQYPQCKGKLGGKTVTLAKYLYDDNVDTSDKSVVVDWYYKKFVNGKQTLQYAKYVNDVVLYATENEIEKPTKEDIDPETGIPVITVTGESMAERGLYDHGLYPFVSMSLYPVEGSLCGYGLTDIARDTQIQIDKLNKAIIDNALAGAKPRHFVKNNGGVNEEEYMDLSKSIIHVEGSPNEDNIRPIDHKPLDGIYVNVLQQKIDEMKFITSNQDVNNGATPSGVTSGSAISALQEASGKNARTSNKAFHRAYREVCYLVLELIRQFYDTPRTFRIMGEGMIEEFVQFDNSGLKPQPQMIDGIDMGLRVPEFDIEVTSEKANPYKSMEINELALNFYNMGFFNPQMTDQALACLNMMDFMKKEEVIQKIQTNGTLQELLLLYQQMALDFANRLDPALGEQVAMQITQQYGGGMAQPQLTGSSVNLDEDTAEHPFNTKARNQARNSTQVD